MNARPTLSVLLALGISTLAGAALADDLNPKLPNVLLLTDNSGSMAQRFDNTSTTDCSSQPSRWSVLAQTLTGTITNMRCNNGPVRSNDCLAQQNPGITGASFSTGWEWPTYTGGAIPAFARDPINFQRNGSDTDICIEGAGGWDQARDGLIDTFSRQVRFGLGMFDGNSNRGTDSSGDWSYWFPSTASNWRDTPGGGFTVGNYGGQTPINQAFEVGMRNPTARPWQGRLMGFGDPNASLDNVEEQNRRIQLAILAMDPETGTPSVGMLRDAFEFISHDDDSIPNYPNTGDTFLMGPATDPGWTDPSQCRKTSIIFITDGEPTTDLTDDPSGAQLPCWRTTGRCPFNNGAVQSPVRTAYYAEQLYTQRNVKVYVLGMALDTTTWQNGAVTETTNCASITAADFAANRVCEWNNTTKVWTKATGSNKVKACCELAETAILGGTNHAYFPTNLTQLKSELGQILADIAGAPTSRTTPAVATALPVMPSSENPSAASYELLSSTRVTVGEGMWRGNVERRRLVCGSTGGDPTPAAIDPARGDDFAENLSAGRTDRRFFTVVAEDSSLFTPSRLMQKASLRPDGFDDDGFRSYEFHQTNLVPIENLHVSAGGFLTDIFRLVGLDAIADGVKCGTLFGATWASAPRCAEAILKWYGGYDSGGPNDRIIGRCPTCSPLGAVFHSSPVVVGPPNEYVRDESYRNEFANVHRKRPTVSYVATLDGQLHAFVLAKNASPGDPAPAAGEPDYRNVPAPNARHNNELWTFIPPIVVPQIFQNFNVNANLLDGGITVQNIVMRRTQAQAEAGTADWRTVAVVSGGKNAAGGFYFALDVTNPLEPEFLWQLSDDGDGHKLFGDVVPAAELATIAITPEGSSVPEQRAVAILSGGSRTIAAPSGIVNRKGTGAPSTRSYSLGDRDEPIRTQIRDWGANLAERSVTIVDLQSGEIIARFVGDAASGGGDPPQLVPGGSSIRSSASDLRLDAGFDSPMVGKPTAFATSPGDLVNRVYVGDADGTMWRLDLSDVDADNWSAAIAWDAYGTAPDGPLDGQPIELPPVMSVDDFGFPVIAFATGVQDNFSNPVPGMKNYVWSFTEQPRVNNVGFESLSGLVGTENYGIVQPFPDGGRVTGPMSLFDGGLYFASFQPGSTATACGSGTPRLWSIDYLDNTAKTDWNNNGTLDRFLDLLDGRVVYGIAASQRPTCVSNTLVDVTTATGYPWLDGPSQALGVVSQPQYQLVMHTGQGAMPDDALMGGSQMGAKTNSYHRDLDAPRITAKTRDVAQATVE